MKKQFKFSVIIPVYNVEDFIEETILSVVNQTIGFEDNIQLVLINDGSPDNSEEICLKYKEKYPDNIVYYKQKNAGVSAARNKGIELVEGEFTTFLDSDDLWSEDSFKEVYKKHNLNPDIKVFSCKLMFFDGQKGNHPLNYKFVEDKIIDILEDWEYPQLSSSSVFIDTKTLKNYRYDVSIKYAEDCKLINEILLDVQKMMVLEKPIYHYRRRIVGTSLIQGQVMDIKWYIDTPINSHRYLYELSKKKYGRVLEYIQYVICYDINWRLFINKNMVLTEEQKKQYVKLLDDLIKDSDEEVIMRHKHLGLIKKIFFLETKGKKNVISDLEFKDGMVSLYDYSEKIKNMGFLYVDRTLLSNKKLMFFGRLDIKYIKEKEFKVKNGNKNIKIDYYELAKGWNKDLYNGNCFHNYIGFKFEIDIKDFDKVSFYKNDFKLTPVFGVGCMFTNSLAKSYHHFGKYTITFQKDSLLKHNKNIFKSFYYELYDELSLLKRKKFKILYVRFVTKMARLFKKKKIWIISDRVDKADDNGEHFFKYMIENYPEEKVYYVINKDCPDYERMKKIGPVLDRESNKFKTIFNRADYVLSSQAENYVFNPLGKSGKLIQDQYYFKFIFLQHGVIYTNLSAWLNVNAKRIDMFVTSCKDEYQSIIDYKYSFGPEVLRLTGLPRHDTLLQKQKKYKVENKIMLSFTWRNNLATVIDKKSGMRLYNDKFKNSDYFKTLNNLMNDKRLLKVLKDNNYKIRFIPHPNVLCQLKDFKKNECVEFAEGAIDYQKEFCTNKLLLTDYSSVFFDFAYLKKPVVYYHENDEEFYKGQIYDEGYFDFKNMGFGPLCEDYDKLINELINLINNDCKLDKKYDKRIDDFFEFRDGKNCERVYKNIKKL